MVHCDNEATVHCIIKRRSHSPALMPVLRCLIWISACDQFILTANHVPGSKNQIADALSCFSFQKMNMASDTDPIPMPIPSLFGIDIQLNHLLKTLLDASLNSIIQTVSPRTLHSYLTAWRNLKAFRTIYNLPSPHHH